MEEEKEFKSDKAKKAGAKNKALARHLSGMWHDKDIVKINRIEIGSAKGWQIIFRT